MRSPKLHTHSASIPTLAACARLNTTVASMAIAVNKVLTAAYHAVYDDAMEDDELVLLVAPLAATTEVQELFTAGIIDIARCRSQTTGTFCTSRLVCGRSQESALPAALHSLGASAVEIEGALKRRRQADKNAPNADVMQAQTAAMLGEYDAQLKGAQTEKTIAEVDKVKADTEKARAEVGKVNAESQKTTAEVGVVNATEKKTEAEVGKVGADTKKTAAEVGKVGAEKKKTEHDARAPYPSAAAKPGGAGKSGGSSGGSSGAKKK